MADKSSLAHNKPGSENTPLWLNIRIQVTCGKIRRRSGPDRPPGIILKIDGIGNELRAVPKPHPMKARVIAAAVVSLILLSGPTIAQMTLSGATMWVAQADGSNDGVTGYGNTLGSDGDGTTVFNVYAFTGSTASPVFLNGGNTNASLNPNLTLSAGAHLRLFDFELRSGNGGEAAQWIGCAGFSLSF